jgi:hypothetical protein
MNSYFSIEAILFLRGRGLGVFGVLEFGRFHHSGTVSQRRIRVIVGNRAALSAASVTADCNTESTKTQEHNTSQLFLCVCSNDQI